MMLIGFAGLGYAALRRKGRRSRSQGSQRPARRFTGTSQGSVKLASN
jgi:hypothetical protein